MHKTSDWHEYRYIKRTTEKTIEIRLKYAIWFDEDLSADFISSSKEEKKSSSSAWAACFWRYPFLLIRLAPSSHLLCACISVSDIGLAPKHNIYLNRRRTKPISSRANRIKYASDFEYLNDFYFLVLGKSSRNKFLFCVGECDAFRLSHAFYSFLISSTA